MLLVVAPEGRTRRDCLVVRMFTAISTRALKPWKIGSQKIPSLGKAQHEQYTLGMHMFRGIQADEFSQKASPKSTKARRGPVLPGGTAQVGSVLPVPSFSQQGSAEWGPLYKKQSFRAVIIPYCGHIRTVVVISGDGVSV